MRWKVLRPWFQSILPAAILGLAAPPQAWSQSRQMTEWTSVENARFGVTISYPANVFTYSEGEPSDEGMAFATRDGRARLLVGAFANSGQTSLQAYRKQVLEENYPGSALDYAPVTSKTFVVSGTLNGFMFYERVHFSCQGRLISSWAMIYPVTERRFYDRVVEAIAPTFKPGKGRDGGCELETAP